MQPTNENCRRVKVVHFSFPRFRSQTRTFEMDIPYLEYDCPQMSLLNACSSGVSCSEHGVRQVPPYAHITSTGSPHPFCPACL